MSSPRTVEAWAVSQQREHVSGYKSVHAQRLERWLGTAAVESISLGMRDWPGPPIALAGVPGRVYACGGGDFCGPLKGGYFANLQDFALQRIRRVVREAARRNMGTASTGFASLSDLISEATAGAKKQVLPYQKVGVVKPAVGASQSLRRQGTQPTAGAIAAGPPGGTAFTDANAGSMPFVNPGSPDTTHFITWAGQQTTAQATSLMLCDLLFAVQPNYNSTSAQAITGVPTRYTTAALAPGNFLPADVTTALAATASNVTITYVDDAGNTAEAGAAQALRISSAAGTSPFTAPQWYYNLNAGDRGVQKMTSFILSVAVNPGAVDRMISHPLAIMPGASLANQVVIVDGINSAFNLERIYDDAYLYMYEWMASATPQSTFAGLITICSG